MGISLSTTAKDLIRSGFFGKDFDTAVNEIVSFLQLRFGVEIANNIVGSEQGVMLIEAFSFGFATANWFGDRQADDTNLRDVRLRAAAVAIARQLGYKPRAAVPPAVEITITLLTVPTGRLTIEKGRKLYGPNGLVFETAEEVIFDPGEVGPKTFGAVQGQTIEEIFTSNGEPVQVFPILTVPTGSSIAQDTPRAFVAANEWPEREFLTFVQDEQFEFQYGFSPPRAIFGDGIAGNIPPLDDEIRIRIFVTDGTGGSVASNTVTTFTQPLVAGLQVIEALLVHNDPSTPGADRETIDSIKINAPQVFQAADRAVTQADIDALINAFSDPVFGAVAIGRATTPRSVEQDAQALTIIAAIETSCPSTLTFGAITSGPFVVGETITGSVSGATSTVVGAAGVDIAIYNTSGSFVSGETITGSTSGATAPVVVVVPAQAAADLRTYWNTVLASNCQANIVVAQILASDSVGRYVSAPSGLARAVEAFLDARLESTVKAQVVDGTINLLSVDLSVQVKTTSAFSAADQVLAVISTVRSVLEAELLGRSYGTSLRISDLYFLADSQEGVDFTNITITNQATRVDAFGNLPIEDFEVITLGVQPVMTPL